MVVVLGAVLEAAMAIMVVYVGGSVGTYSRLSRPGVSSPAPLPLLLLSLMPIYDSVAAVPLVSRVGFAVMRVFSDLSSPLL